MSLLYKNPEDIEYDVEIRKTNGKVRMLFFSDCGKHGTEELMDGYSITPERLLKVMQSYKDYTEEELDI